MSHDQEDYDDIMKVKLKLDEMRWGVGSRVSAKLIRLRSERSSGTRKSFFEVAHLKNLGALRKLDKS